MSVHNRIGAGILEGALGGKGDGRGGWLTGVGKPEAGEGGRHGRGEGRGLRGGIAGRALGRSELRGSPGRRQTLCGDVTPELETMINMIICIKSEWVLFSGRMPRMMNGPGSQIDG